MGWEKLIAIRESNRRFAEEELRQPPAYCPHDGTLLQVRSDGVRNCPMGNYTWEP